MSCEFTPNQPQAAQVAPHRPCGTRANAPTLTAAEVEARELAETLAEERAWVSWLLAGVGVLLAAAFALGYLTAALSLG